MTLAPFPVPPIVKDGDGSRCAGAGVRAFCGRFRALSRVHTGPDPVDCAIEPRVGGRVFERAADGHETAWGTVLAYDPPHRLTFSWIVELPAGQEQLVRSASRRKIAAPRSSAKPAGGKRSSPSLSDQVLALASGKTQQEIAVACKGARPNHVGAATSRHKRVGRIEDRDGKLYAT